MHRHSFYIDGVSSRNYGIVCSGYKTMDAPQRDVQRVSVPGRNGDLTIDNGRYLNIDVEYDAVFVYNFRQNAEAVRAWLCQSAGYRRLEDDWNPDSYRMARFVDGIEMEIAPLYDVAKATLRFNCMPQRWLKSGEEPVVFSAGGDLINPTLFNAQPKIVLSGNGTLTINGNTVTIADNTGEIILDSEICRAYSGTTAKDDKMTGDFPVLVPGGNAIAFTGFTSMEITPRWWTL